MDVGQHTAAFMALNGVPFVHHKTPMHASILKTVHELDVTTGSSTVYVSDEMHEIL